VKWAPVAGLAVGMCIRAALALRKQKAVRNTTAMAMGKNHIVLRLPDDLRLGADVAPPREREEPEVFQIEMWAYPMLPILVAAVAGQEPFACIDRPGCARRRLVSAPVVSRRPGVRWMRSGRTPDLVAATSCGARR
jgi:hypothetical protein